MRKIISILKAGVIWMTLLMSYQSFADWGFPEDNNVVMLDIYNHDRFLKEYEETLVYYFIDDCEHCKNLKPIYSRLGLEYKEKKQRIPLAQFDCTEHTRFCEEKLIPVYPFLKFYVKQHPIQYLGKRTYNALDKYLNYMTTRKPDRTDVANFLEIHQEYYNPLELDPSLFTNSELRTEINFRKEKTNTVLGVFFGKKSRNRKLFHIFDLYFKYDAHVQFMHIKKLPELHRSNLKIFGDVMAEGDSLNGKVVLFFKDRSVRYKGKADFDSFENTVHELKYPLVQFLNPEFYKNIGGERMKMVLLFVSREDHPVISQLSRLSKQFFKKFRFVVIANNSEHGEMVNEFKDKFLKLKRTEFDLENEPQLRIIEVTFSTINSKRFILDEPFSFDSGLNFIVNYTAGKLKYFMKSEKIFEEKVLNSEVKHVNSEMFDSLIKVPGQNSMVLYHEGLDNDNQTKLFLDYMIELSNKSGIKGIQFFAFNAEKNDLSEFYDDERPVLLYYSAKNIYAPSIYNKRFNKLEILKMVARANKTKSSSELLEKTIFKNKG